MTAGRREDTRDRLRRLVAAFPDRRICVLGDFVADEFVDGDIARVSREAPVLILRHRRTETVLGGGANTVANLCALGARVLPVGVVGDDATGRALLERFEALDCPLDGIVIDPRGVTPTKSRVMAGGVHTRRQQIVRIDRGERTGPLPRKLARALDARLVRAMRHAEGTIVADYGYDAATPERLASARERLERPGPVVVDSRARVVEFRGAMACTPNQEELERALGLEPPIDDAALEAAGRRLLSRARCTALLVTRGARGMSLFRARRPVLHVPAYGSDEVADVTGAGDTVIATFALSLLAGADYDDAARLANYAAGLVVMKAGTATVEPAELDGAIAEDQGA